MHLVILACLKTSKQSHINKTLKLNLKKNSTTLHLLWIVKLSTISYNTDI